MAENIRVGILKDVKALGTYAQSGQNEPVLSPLNKGHRYLLSGNYKVIYLIHDSTIFITDVFDTRRDPLLMKKRGRK